MSDTKNPISAILNIAPVNQTFSFYGRRFEYHAAGNGTFETIYTRWAAAPRAVSADTLNLEQALASLLMHKFRRNLRRAEIDAVLAEVDKIQVDTRLSRE